MCTEEEKEQIRNRNICYDIQEKYNMTIEDLRLLIDSAFLGWRKKESNDNK